MELGRSVVAQGLGNLFLSFFFFFKEHAVKKRTPAWVLVAPSALPLPGLSRLSLLLHRAARLSLPPLLAGAGRPTPSWLAQPVFVIVVLALSQGWLGARLVGTVCTVSALPSLSSYAIIFFF